MRLAAYNVENLFDRPRAMNQDTWQDGKPILEKFASLNQLLGQVEYSSADKDKMATLMVELGLENSDTGPFVILRRNRGGFVKRPTSGGLVITAEGRADWVGLLELRTEPINEHAMRNTARVIRDLEADVLGVVEAESRPVLYEFNTLLLPAVQGTPFRHVMVIDGNDVRGIDVGLMTLKGFRINPMRSHVDDEDDRGQLIFSRDCPEYTVTTPKGNELVVMVNHFKSKGYGSKASSDARRRAQAERVKEIYQGLLEAGKTFVAVIGDLNDTPDSKPLEPLLKGTNLKDAFEHDHFDKGGYEGTHGSCKEKDKIDYLLLSPELYQHIESGGVWRKGMWPGVRPKRWDVYDELTREEDAASDHAAIWVDIDI